MTAADNLGTQFHEMTKDEFEKQPGTFFHGSVNGMVGAHGGSVHVGTKRAAVEALASQLGNSIPTDIDPDHAIQSFKGHAGVVVSGSDGRTPLFASSPDVTPVRVTGRMANTPHLHPSRGPLRGEGQELNLYKGIPNGDYHDWEPMDDDEPISDRRANEIATEHGHSRGHYYVNGVEDPGSISAVVPKRSHLKTYEDYVAEALHSSKKVPERVLKQFPAGHIPGQQRLF